MQEVKKSGVGGKTREMEEDKHGNLNKYLKRKQIGKNGSTLKS